MIDETDTESKKETSSYSTTMTEKKIVVDGEKETVADNDFFRHNSTMQVFI